MFGAVLDRIGGSLGLPNTWERRTKAAVLEACDLLRYPEGRSDILVASAHLYEPAVVHGPTGWKIVFPRSRDGRRLEWFRTTEGGHLMLQTGALRDGVWLETRISGPGGVLGLADAFEGQASGALERVGEASEILRRPPGEDGAPGEFRVAFHRNGAPLSARMLMLPLKDHLIQVFYETPARLADAATALSEEAIQIGLQSAKPPDIPPSSPEELAEAMRGFGMSEAQIAEALKDPETCRL